MITVMVDTADKVGALARELVRRAAVAFWPPTSSPIREDAGGAGAAGRTFRWEWEMLPAVAESIKVFAPWLESPGAVLAEVPAAVGIVDVVAVRFDSRSLQRRCDERVHPVLLPLRVRTLYALRDRRPRRLETLASVVGSRPEALARSTVGPLAQLGLLEITPRGSVRSTGLWLPAGGRLMAVELKLSKWRTGLNQADNFARSVDQAWVVLDARRVRGALRSIGEFAERGVGLAVVVPDGDVDVLLRPTGRRPEGWLRALLAERALAVASGQPQPVTADDHPSPGGPPSEPRAVAVMT
jgi:hypothetical protein